MQPESAAAHLAPLDVAFLRRLNAISPHVLLTATRELAKSRERAAIVALCDLFASDGPVDLFIVGGSTVPLSNIVAEALAPEKPENFDADQSAHDLQLIARFVDLIRDPERRQCFVDGVLFRCASLTWNPAMFHGLLALGANPRTRGSTSGRPAGGICELYSEAAKHGNFSFSLEIAKLHSEPNGIVDSYVRSNYSPLKLGGSEQTEQDANLSRLLACAEVMPDAAFEMLDGFQAVASLTSVATLRAQLMLLHLAQSIESKTAWNEDLIRRIMGELGSEIHEALLLLAQEDAAGIPRELEGQSLPRTFKQLCELACNAHCAPVLEIFPARLQALSDLDYKHEEDPLHAVLAADGCQSSPARLRETLELLVAKGFRLDRSELRHPSAFHLAAKARARPDHVLMSLRVLLEMGLDPKQVDTFGASPDLMLKSALRKQWVSMCRSFEARKVAVAAVDEVSALAPAP